MSWIKCLYNSITRQTERPHLNHHVDVAFLYWWEHKTQKDPSSLGTSPHNPLGYGLVHFTQLTHLWDHLRHMTLLRRNFVEAYQTRIFAANLRVPLGFHVPRPNLPLGNACNKKFTFNIFRSETSHVWINKIVITHANLCFNVSFCYNIGKYFLLS